MIKIIQLHKVAKLIITMLLKIILQKKNPSDYFFWLTD